MTGEEKEILQVSNPGFWWARKMCSPAFHVRSCAKFFSIFVRAKVRENIVESKNTFKYTPVAILIFYLSDVSLRYSSKIGPKKHKERKKLFLFTHATLKNLRKENMKTGLKWSSKSRQHCEQNLFMEKHETDYQIKGLPSTTYMWHCAMYSKWKTKNKKCIKRKEINLSVPLWWQLKVKIVEIYFELSRFCRTLWKGFLKIVRTKKIYIYDDVKLFSNETILLEKVVR